MSFNTQCPHCRSALSVPASSGHNLVCPKCNSPFSLGPPSPYPPPAGSPTEFNGIGNVNDEGGVQRHRANRKAMIPAVFHVAAWMAVVTMLAVWLFVVIDLAAFFKRRSDVRSEEDALMKRLREETRPMR